MKIPVIGITIGDVAGIGPEVIVRSLSEKKARDFIPVIIGSKKILEDAANYSKVSLNIVQINDINREDLKPENVYCFDNVGIDANAVALGKGDDICGKYAMACIDAASEMALRGSIDAIATAPVNKEVICNAGYDFQGHTGYLAEKSGAKKYRMMFAGKGLKFILVTTHIPLKEVSQKLDKGKIADTILFAHKAAALFGKEKPKIAVCGLNPHAGEGGLMGKEENEIISPAIEEVKGKGVNAAGPFPPDTIFGRVLKREFDFVVAMYHDQALIPFKMVAFEEGVNITLGMPYIRTSPDHGTAYAIAGKGIADRGSMKEAIRLAVELSKKSSGKKIEWNI
ncbi:4-hydroxythreonine-4-phosphate dehydrogenase PdxA [Candidatus Auribacterota bacterium]